MTDEPFATVEDLQARWRPLDPAETIRAQALLADASGIIRDAVREWEKASADTLRRIVCAMVRRAMLTPAGAAPVSQMAETAGPFSQQMSFVNPAGDLYLTRAERRALTGTAGSRAWQVDLLDGGDGA